MIGRVALVLSLTVAASPCAFPQAYPSKPISVIVAFTPGGASDFLARMLAQKVSETAGWRMVVENKPGASGHIGTEHVAKPGPMPARWRSPLRAPAPAAMSPGK